MKHHYVIKTVNHRNSPGPWLFLLKKTSGPRSPVPDGPRAPEPGRRKDLAAELIKDGSQMGLEPV